MGSYLSSPITEKHSEEGGEEGWAHYGASAMQGWRNSMEDAHLAALSVDASRRLSVFGVFDGHAGPEVSTYAAQQFVEVFRKSDALRKDDLGGALKETFLGLDAIIASPNGVRDLVEIANSKKGTDQSSSSALQEVLEMYGVKLPLEKVQKLVHSMKHGMKKEKRKNGRAAHNSGGSGSSGWASSSSSSSSSGGGASRAQASIVAAVTTALLTDAFGGGGGEEEADDEEHEEEEDGEEGGDADQKDSQQGDDEADGKGAEEQEAEEEEEEEQEEEEMDGGQNRASALLKRLPVQLIKDLFLNHSPGVDSGTTATVALLKGREALIVANAGDSRCVLSRGGRAIEMSRDHKPEDEDEFARISAAGGAVSEGRVQGNLNLSRALGDFTYKQNKNLPPERQMITALPEIKEEKLLPEDEFFVVACDGIWNVMSSQQVIDFVRPRLQGGVKLSAICEEICDRCCEKEMTDESDGSGCDNMTVMIVTLPPPSSTKRQGTETESGPPQKAQRLKE